MAPTWLPLPSLLPSNLQKRLLSYALTNILGTFLEPQTFSHENLELQLLNGSVSLRNLDLNASKVNALLRLPGIEIVNGHIGHVTVQIPVRDVLSGRISVKINSVHVVVRPSEKRVIVSEPVPDLTPDSLAHSFLQTSIHDPTDSVLLDTLSESIHSQEELGLGPAEEEGMFTSILASFMDALKARLAIELEDLSVHVQHPRSGAFILAMSRISFLPNDDNVIEKVLVIGGIEAYLRNEDQQLDDNQSVTSESTIISPSSPIARSPGTDDDDHLLSQSMMFSAQEASSLYMSAYSQPSQSRYVEPQSEASPEQNEDTPLEPSEDKGFRFFYFEEDLIFHVITSSTDSDPASIPSKPTQKSRPAPILQSAIPTANLILNPDVNLLPSISLIATILSLSPETNASTPSESPVTDPSGGLDFLWEGGVVIHFGSDDVQTIARLADWQVKKTVGDDALTISMGIVEVVASTGQKILSTKPTPNRKSEGRLNLTLGAKGVDILLPEVDLQIDLDGLKSLQPLLKAVKRAWHDTTTSVAATSGTATPVPATAFREEHEASDDEDWNENLLIERVSPSTSTPSRPLHLSLDRLNLVLPVVEGQADNLTFSIEGFSLRTLSAGHTSVDFSSAQLLVSSNPLLTLSSPSTVRAMVDFVFSDGGPVEKHVRMENMQEILDDFLVGEGNRSDDAWGIIRTDAMNEGNMVVKIRLPKFEFLISEPKMIHTTRLFMRRLEEMLVLFAELETTKPTQSRKTNEMVVEFAFGEGLVQLQLDSSETLESHWEGFEGTIVKGIADEDTVGALDMTKFSLHLSSGASVKLVHESIHRGNDSTPCVGLKFVQSADGQFIGRTSLYNLNFEYFVYNPWVEKVGHLFSTPSMKAAETSTPELRLPLPAQFSMSLSDCTVGLNPLNLQSRGLLLISSTTVRGQWDFQQGGLGKFDVSINKAHLFCIDSASNLLPPPTHTRPRLTGRKEILAHFTDLGYALCATMPTGNATVRFFLSEARTEIDVEDVGLQLDTCADSTQTLGDLFNDLKPPIELDEGRYRSAGSESIDVLQDIDENAFGGSFNSKDPIPQDEDLVLDDVPFNLAFVESYYGDQSRIKSSPSSSRGPDATEEEADELLAEGDDIGHFAEPPKPAIPVDKGKFGEFEEQIRVFGKPSSTGGLPGSVRFIDEHFPSHSVLQENAFLSSENIIKLRLRNTRVVWNLHDGYDWPRTREAIALAVQKVEQKAAEALAAKARRKTPQPTRTVSLPEVLYGDDPWTFDEEEEDDVDDDSEIGDILFNSIYVGVRRGQDPRSLARNINRDLDAQSETTSQVSTTPSSPMRSSRGASPGYSSSNALDRTRRPAKSLRLKRSKTQKVQINLRSLGVDFDLLPDPQEPGQTILSTIRLKVGDLEILDNVPTSSWNKFVTYWRGGDKRRRETASAMVDLEIANVKPVQHLSASELVIQARVLPLKLHVDQDTLDFITRFFEFKDQSALPPSAAVPEPPFIQRIEVYPVNVMLDYKPKKVDYAGLRSGRTTEFMNFFTLEEAEILLRRITLYGISGYPKLFQKLNDIWMPDIRGNQLLDVLGGINYVRPFANIGGGVKDLILVPIKEYQKDGRVLQGTGKGVITFGKTLTNELLKVGAKVAVGAQKGLEWGEGLIEGRPQQTSAREGVRFDDDDFDDMESDPRVVTLSPYADQPANIQQGIKRAIESLVRNAKSAGETVIAIPQEVAESGTAAGAGKTVLKAIPVAIIRPLIGASGAVSNTLMGIHNTLDSNQQRNIEDKYKR